MDKDFLESLAHTAQHAARAGGERLLALQSGFEYREKAPADFVTDADFASQEAIRDIVLGRFPDHQFVGEEDAANRPQDPDAVCWIVDPLDGTTNYVHRFPYFSVSVAVAQGQQLLAGVVFDPVHDELFSAAQGGGARLGETAISVSKTANLHDALVAMSLPPRVRPDSPDLLDFQNVVGRCRAVRRIGSAALNLAYLAAGRLDGYWAREINAWDVAAGVLLIREAGGVVTSSTGEEFDLWRADLAAGGARSLHPELLAELAKS